MGHPVVHVYHERVASRIADAIRDRDPELSVVTWSSPEELQEGIGEAEVVFASIPPRGLWSGADRLRLVQLMGAGVDVLLPAPDLPAGVQVAGCRGVFAAETAEHAVLMLLAFARDLPALLAEQRARRFHQRAVRSLAGQTLLVVGLGEIGGRVARAARALDMTVLGIRRAPRPTPDVDETHGPDALPELLPRADAVVLCLPLTPESRRLLDGERIALMRDDALLVNIGRGGLVDEEALCAALKAGTLAGAALDVFEVEPLPSSSPLWDAPRLIITPHLAGFGERYLERAVEVLVDNVRRLNEGAPLRCLVSRETGY